MRDEPRVHGKFHIIPFPKEREAWFVWQDHEGSKPEGPYPVIAVGMPITEYSWDGEWNKRGRPEDPLDWDIEFGTDYLENALLRYFVLWTDTKFRESAWVDQDYVFFSGSAAMETLLNQRKAKAEAELKASNRRRTEPEQARNNDATDTQQESP